MADKMTFMKSWRDAIMEDDYVRTTPQEMAYILYAAMVYSFSNEKIDLGDIFGAEFKGLNRAMPNIYSQIDSIQEYGLKNQLKNQRYDNEEIRKLAAKGYTQRKICEVLGYDVDKCRSLSSNIGYREGRAEWMQRVKMG